MKIKLDKDTMPDELYNMLLQQFVNEAVSREIDVTKWSRFEKWEISCELEAPMH